MKYTEHRSNNTNCNNIIKLIKNTVSCNENMIHQIDTILETNHLPTSVKERLANQRNTCAVIYMNLVKEIDKHQA